MAGLIVHEWMSPAGGSENVVEALAEAIPDADLFCLWNDSPNRFPNRHVAESWLARTPLRGRKALSLPFMPGVWRNLPKGDNYDWILASSHLFAHQARFACARDVPKYVYVHTPARYIWAPELDRRGFNPFARVSAPFFRKLDRHFAQDPASIAANSEYVRRRIEDAWHREAKVIYPPVEVTQIQSVENWATRLTAAEQDILSSLPRMFVLGASRFVSYKRLDLVIDVGEAVDVPVVLAGAGPELPALRARAQAARVPVVIVDQPSDALLYSLYQSALVFVFPPVEDFGIMPVEAMACGTPVMVNALGGSRESVSAAMGGSLIESFDRGGLSSAFEQAASIDRRKIAYGARSFSTERFAADILKWLQTDLKATSDSVYSAQG